MGVLNTLAGAAKRKLTSPEGKKNIKGFALSAGARLARTAWDWSGANDVGILHDAVSVSGRAYDYLKANRRDDRQGDQPKALPQRPNNRSQGVTPKPLALPVPTRQSNQEARAARQVSAETREKLRAASKANAEQRAATRQSNLAAMRERAERAEQMLLERRQLETQEKTGDTQVKIYDELEAIHALMRRDGNPLLNRPGAKKGEGGGLLSTVLGAAGSIPGLGGLLGGVAGGAAGGLGGKVLGKVGGLVAKVPGLAKVIPGIAGMAIPGLGGFAAGAATSAGGAAASGGAAKAAGSLASKVGDVTDVVAKPVAEKAGAKAAAKGLGKAVLKKIPLIGALAGIGFGISRAAKGDWTGAGLEVASGLAGTVPGLGTAASVGIDATLAARDYAAEQEAAGGSGVTPPPPAGTAPAAPATPPQPESTGAERREAFAGGLMPTRQNDGDFRGTRGENRVVPQIESSGASQTWRNAARAEEDVRVIDLLTTLTSAMLDRDKGIYVKPSKDVFSTDESPFQQTTYKPSADGTTGQGVSRGQTEPVDLSGPVPTARPSQVKVAPIGGAGFTPNSERPQAPRPFLGGGATPEPRQDISQAVAKDASVAIKAPAGPTVGVKMAGKGFKGFGDDVDAHIKEASQKYGISEDVLRGFVKMEGGWTGAMSPTGAIGTGQFIQSTWDGLAKTKEGQEIGMTKIGDRFRTENDPRRDKRTNTLATGLLAKQNADMLKANGLEATGENLYMMHNIGPGVIKAMKGEKVSDATLLAMKQNGMKDGMTPQDFVAYQKQRFNSHYAQANAPEVLAAAKNSGVATSPVAVADAKTKDVTPGVTPAVKRPASTSIEQNAMTLAASQREADAAAQKPPVVVVAGNQGGQAQPRQASNAAGDSKPGVVVRNNESSLSRVTDSLIARTIT